MEKSGKRVENESKETEKVAAAHSSDVLLVPCLDELPVHTLLQRTATELSQHMEESTPLIVLFSRRQVGDSTAP